MEINTHIKWGTRLKLSNCQKDKIITKTLDRRSFCMFDYLLEFFERTKHDHKRIQSDDHIDDQIRNCLQDKYLGNGMTLYLLHLNIVSFITYIFCHMTEKAGIIWVLVNWQCDRKEISMIFNNMGKSSFHLLLEKATTRPNQFSLCAINKYIAQ